MGDFIQGSDILKKIGFNETNQWVIYDESYQTFFNWFTTNITNQNTLSDLEILEISELKKENIFFENEILFEKLSQINTEYYNILEYTDENVMFHKIELQNIRDVYEMYNSLGQQIEQTRFNLNRELHKLESEIQVFESKEEILQRRCLEKARELQEYQKQNKKLCNELNDCIFKLSSPPLFTHQFPMEQYLLKCDSFMQYFSLYLQENFKFQDFLESENEDSYVNEVAPLEKLKHQISCYNEKYSLAKAKLNGLQRMVEHQDSSKIYITNISNLKKETRELEILNGASFDIAYETLMNDLKLYIQQIAQQQIEFVLYQNTKEKIKRACQRLDSINSLSKIISNVLKNSELMWIMMQLDGEKLKNRTDNSESLLIESQNCNKRIDLMKQIQNSQSFNLNEYFMTRLSDMLMEYLGSNNLKTLKIIMNSIESFNRSSENSLINLSSDKCYQQVLAMLTILKSIENTLSQYVFDGSTNRPVLRNIKFLQPIIKFKMFKEMFEKSLRKLRSEFHEKISSRMSSDKLWRNGQLLWIWFLTEPKKVISVLEEIRRAAQDVSSSTGIKPLVGIKRQRN